jgi:uncharacterized protein (DUF362 family)
VNPSSVAIVPYEEPLASVRRAIELSRGFAQLKLGMRVFIKPNIVFWTRLTPFPKWGVITTTRVVADVVVLLKEQGIDEITIGEGIVGGAKDTETPTHAFDNLGYTTLAKRYGVKVVNVMERPFERVDLGDEMHLRFNTDILHSDFVVDLPVLKTHVQTVVSLGIKNLKGTIDMPSRKRCHNPDPVKDLHYWVARLADPMPPMLTLIDGIYSNERGPAFDGRLRRTNLLIASSDSLSADLVGARILGYKPEEVPHLVHAAHRKGRPVDLTDIQIRGTSIDSVQRRHEYDHSYVQNAEGEWLPAPLAKQGIQGLSYRKYDTTMCTYCSVVNGLLLGAVRMAWQGKAWDKVEILSGKSMQPTPGMKKTILLGKCIYQANKEHPDIQEMIAVKGCPPDPKKIVAALHQAGISADPNIFDQADMMPGLFMARYQKDPAFEERFFQIE